MFSFVLRYSLFIAYPDVLSDLVDYNNPYLYTVASISTGTSTVRITWCIMYLQSFKMKVVVLLYSDFYG